MPFVMVDIEADGPIPGDFSMVSFAAIVVEKSLDRTFAAQLRPISERWVPEALAVTGFSREQTLAFAVAKSRLALQRARQKPARVVQAPAQDQAHSRSAR